MSADEKETGFVVMAKPVGSLCNLRCRYCYYLGADARRLGKNTSRSELADRNHEIGDSAAEEQTAPSNVRIMSSEVLEALISQCIEGRAGNRVQFFWHGGEPTLAGIDFYRRAVELQKKFCPPGVEIWNNIQTNGVLIDDEWAAFLSENHFDVGLSIDGTEMLHDDMRRHPDGSPSYDEAVRAIECLKRRGILPDLLCTVTRQTAAQPEKVYRALKSFHTGWIQFIPIVVKTGKVADGVPVLTEESVPAEAYGKFLNAVFDEWISHDLGQTDVQLFAETAGQMAGNAPSLCTLAPECGRVPVLEADGRVYACDHFVDREHCLGNILEERIPDLLMREEQRAFGRNKRAGLASACLSCPWIELCHGGCLKDRFLPDGRHVLCEGFRMFYSHAEQFLPGIMEMSSRGVPQGTIMASMRTKLKKLGKRH